MGQMRVRRTGPWVKISCPFSWVQFSSRWGQRLGQKKATRPNSNLRKAKVLEIRRFRGLLVRREGFEPPAFWSVGCLTRKSESFRLRFVLFTAVRSANFPLFPSGPARFFRILGQKWVKRSPANTVDLQSRIDLRLSEEVRAENCSDFSHIFQSCDRIVHEFYGII